VSAWIIQKVASWLILCGNQKLSDIGRNLKHAFNLLGITMKAVGNDIFDVSLKVRWCVHLIVPVMLTIPLILPPYSRRTVSFDSQEQALYLLVQALHISITARSRAIQ